MNSSLRLPLICWLCRYLQSHRCTSVFCQPCCRRCCWHCCWRCCWQRQLLGEYQSVEVVPQTRILLRLKVGPNYRFECCLVPERHATTFLLLQGTAAAATAAASAAAPVAAIVFRHTPEELGILKRIKWWKKHETHTLNIYVYIYMYIYNANRWVREKRTNERNWGETVKWNLCLGFFILSPDQPLVESLFVTNRSVWTHQLYIFSIDVMVSL